MMISRDRVLLALDHHEPDRIPIAPPGGRVNLEDDVKCFIEEFDFDLFEKMNFVKNFDEIQQLFKDIYIDDYGCLYRHKGVSEIPHCIYHPLRDIKGVKGVEDYGRWPNLNVSSLLDKGARKKAEEISEKTTFVRVLDVAAIFHRYARMRGFNRWLIDMKTNPKIYDAITSKILSIRLKSTLKQLNEVGDYVDIVRLGDDLGSTKGPFMSLDDFKLYIKPYYERLIGEIKHSFPRVKFWLHSHGAIMKLVPELINVGIEVLNPVLPGDNMNPQLLKKEFGKKLCFDGGVDVESILLFGTVEQVEHHVKDIIETLAHGGGYIFRVQMISNRVPRENLYTAYEKALEFGNYGF